MAQSQSNIERLESAGILKSEHFSDHDRKMLESISDEEIEVLIRLRSKMGGSPDGKDHMRPNIIV